MNLTQLEKIDRKLDEIALLLEKDKAGISLVEVAFDKLREVVKNELKDAVFKNYCQKRRKK